MGDSIQADLVLLNGSIYGLSDNRKNGLVIKNKKIDLIGESTLLKQIPAKNQIDLKGRALYPGFTAAHDHFMMYCQITTVIDIKTRLNESIADYLHRLKNKIPERPRGEWIYCRGLAEFKLKEKRYPILAELDELAPDNPLSILHSSMHSVVVNSRALKEIGINLNSASDGENSEEVVRGEKGRATGLLHEGAAIGFSFPAIRAAFLEKSTQEQRALVEKGSNDFAAYGYTAIHDPMTAPDDFRVYQNVTDCIKQKIILSPSYDDCKELFKTGILSGFGGKKMRIGSVKLFADGAIGGKTAAIKEPYLGTTNSGILNYTQEELDRIVIALDREGYQIAIHAVGDRAVEQVLNSYEKVIDPSKGNIKRHRIEHGSVQSEELIQKTAKHGIILTIQPHALYELGDGVVNSFGRGRLHRFCPYKSFLQAGITTAGSSDSPIFETCPLKGMASSVTRKTEAGLVLTPSERLSPEEALSLYTKHGAFALNHETFSGAITLGADADLVVVTEEITKTSPDQWGSSVRVEMTIANGEVVFSR